MGNSPTSDSVGAHFHRLFYGEPTLKPIANQVVLAESRGHCETLAKPFRRFYRQTAHRANRLVQVFKVFQ